MQHYSEASPSFYVPTDDSDAGNSSDQDTELYQHGLESLDARSYTGDSSDQETDHPAPDDSEAGDSSDQETDYRAPDDSEAGDSSDQETGQPAPDDSEAGDSSDQEADDLAETSSEHKLSSRNVSAVERFTSLSSDPNPNPHNPPPTHDDDPPEATVPVAATAAGTGPRDYRTIFSNTPSSTRQFEVELSRSNLKPYREDLNSEMWWNELPCYDWFKACIPPSILAQCPTDGYNKIHMDEELPPLEKDLYPGIRDGLNGLLPNTELVVYCNAEKPDRLPSGRHKTVRPDMGLYFLRSGAKEAYSDDPPPEVSSDQSAVTGAPDTLEAPESLNPAPTHLSTEDKARMAWAAVEVVIEVKRADNRAPFGHASSKSYLPHGAERVQARGQLIHYAIEVYNHQHRTHIFMISIVGHTARLLYMDRVAVLVSKPFNYVENPVELGMFLHAYSNMTREQRGFDPTASPASPDEVALFRGLALDADPESAVGRGLKWAATPGWPIVALDILSTWSDPDTFLDGRTTTQLTTHRCLVGRPAHQTASLVGRGTRCFVAYDKTEQKALYIKDSWRPVSADIPSEFDNYQRLLEKLGRDGLQDNFLTLRAGGDVLWRAPGDDVNGTPRTQRTFTQGLLNATLPGLPLPRQHTRLVFKEVCKSLEDFEDARELLDVVGFALHAHKDAWEIAGLLHRDLSVGNILIYDSEDSSKFSAILADWDLAKTRERLLPGNQRATQPGPTSGTWQFKSAVLQCCPSKLWEVSDDLESIFHILNWCSLKYLPHSLTDQKDLLTLQFHRWYDAPVIKDPSGLGSEWMFSNKFQAVSGGRPFVQGLPNENVNPLAKLLKTLGELCKMHYASDDIKRFWPDIIPPKVDEPVGAAKTMTKRPNVFRPGRVLESDDESDTQPTGSGAAAGEAEQPQHPTSSTGATSPLKDHTLFIEAFKPYLGRAHKKKVGWTEAACEKLGSQLVVLNLRFPAGLGLRRTFDSYSEEESGSTSIMSSSFYEGEEQAPASGERLGRLPAAGPSGYATPGSAVSEGLSPSPSGSRAISRLPDRAGSRASSVPVTRGGLHHHASTSVFPSSSSITLPPPIPAPHGAQGRVRNVRPRGSTTSKGKGKGKGRGKGKARDVD